MTVGRVERVTLDDVAASAGVSRATASRALTGSGPASAAVQERVKAAAEQLGFTPNQAAQALASKRAPASDKTRAIALVIPEPTAQDMTDRFVTGMIAGMAEALRSTNFRQLLVVVHPDDPPEKTASLVNPGFVDGAIVLSHQLTVPVDRALDRDIVPTVYVGRPRQRETTVMYVDVDNWLGARQATRRLIERGAKKIGCIAGPSEIPAVQDRTSGWNAGLREAGYEPGPIVSAAFSRAGGAEAMRQMLDNEFDAVFVQSDMMAVGAIQVLTKAGRTVGTDPLIVSFDDSDVARLISPRLTSVTNPPAELSLRASRMLLRVLDSDQEPGVVKPDIITPALVIRESG
ncbi:MAG: LacI family transcriptional regulator [Propionibacteriaceae bacterium]|nr:LacI family transcriptional regulator [Propionibacteriaceae bacterium]